jgi:hypothetical protein
MDDNGAAVKLSDNCNVLDVIMIIFFYWFYNKIILEFHEILSLLNLTVLS